MRLLVDQGQGRRTGSSGQRVPGHPYAERRDVLASRLPPGPPSWSVRRPDGRTGVPVDARGHRAEWAQGPGSRDPARFPAPGTGPSTPFPRQGKASLSGLHSGPGDPGFSSSTANAHGRPGPSRPSPSSDGTCLQTNAYFECGAAPGADRSRPSLPECLRKGPHGTARPRLPLHTSARDAGSPDSSLSCSGSSFWRQPLFLSRNNNDSSAFFPGAGGALLLWALLCSSRCPPARLRGLLRCRGRPRTFPRVSPGARVWRPVCRARVSVFVSRDRCVPKRWQFGVFKVFFFFFGLETQGTTPRRLWQAWLRVGVLGVEMCPPGGLWKSYAQDP